MTGNETLTEPRTSEGPPPTHNLASRAWALKFAALRNAHYHKARQRRLEFWARASNFMVVALGAAAATEFGTGVIARIIPGIDTKAGGALVGFFIATLGAAQLVYDWSGRARTHEFLQRRFFEILAKLEEFVEQKEENYRKLEAELVRIYADEPPTLRALDSIAFNETRDALGSTNGSDDRLVLKWYHSLFRHLFAFPATHFPTAAEARLARERNK